MNSYKFLFFLCFFTFSKFFFLYGEQPQGEDLPLQTQAVPLPVQPLPQDTYSITNTIEKTDPTIYKKASPPQAQELALSPSPTPAVASPLLPNDQIVQEIAHKVSSLENLTDDELNVVENIGLVFGTLLFGRQGVTIMKETVQHALGQEKMSSSEAWRVIGTEDSLQQNVYRKNTDAPVQRIQEIDRSLEKIKMKTSIDGKDEDTKRLKNRLEAEKALLIDDYLSSADREKMLEQLTIRKELLESAHNKIKTANDLMNSMEDKGIVEKLYAQLQTVGKDKKSAKLLYERSSEYIQNINNRILFEEQLNKNSLLQEDQRKKLIDNAISYYTAVPGELTSEEKNLYQKLVDKKVVSGRTQVPTKEKPSEPLYNRVAARK